MGQGDAAIAELKKSIDGNKDHDRETWMAIAQVYEKSKNYPEMTKALDEAEKRATAKEDKVTPMFMRGAMYERQKKFEEAEKEFRRVLEIDPDNAAALNYLGYMLADQNVRLPEAQKLIQKAVESGTG